MNIDNTIDNYLQAEYDKKREGYERSGLYVASSLGRCYLYQLKYRLDDPFSNPPDVKGFRRMSQGTNLHKFIQEHFPKEVQEVTVKTKLVKGRADLVFDEIVYDIKGSEEWQYKRYWRIPTHKIILDKFNYFLQVLFYAYTLKKSKAGLLGWVYGTYTFTPHIVEVKDYIQDIEGELFVLESIWARYLKNGELPEPKPRAFGGNECLYCPYKDWCIEHRKEVKKDD